MKNSIETAVESYFIALLRTDARLKGRNIVHSDNDAKANSNAIVVAATQGEAALEGVAGARVEVTCEYSGSIRSTSTQNDVVGLAMNETITTANQHPTKQQNAFSYLVLKTEEMKSERPDTENSRRRMLTVPCLAKLK